MSVITASILYSYIQCPHRVWMDAFENTEKRDRVSAFVELLWKRGVIFEQETVRGIADAFVDFSSLTDDQREIQTIAAMRAGAPLILGGRISHGDLLGEPDLLRREGAGYVAGDIKSGAGEEGGNDDDGRPKRHYAVQLALYTDILERLGVSFGRRGFVWDVHGEEVLYDLSAALGVRNPQTLWNIYEQSLVEVRTILDGRTNTLPAAVSVCKLCHWYSACRQTITEIDDLTMVAELGRTRRDAMIGEIRTVTELAEASPEAFIQGSRSRFRGVGPDMLRKFHERARLLKTEGAKPYLKAPVRLPVVDRELFFDIEVDPLRDHVYLHGIVVRDRGIPGDRFVSFVAESPSRESERQAFGKAIQFLRGSAGAILYVYSAYERTTYRKLQQRYPEVCSADDVEALFAQDWTVDLYAVVRSFTEWPTWDQSIKTLAKYLGFKWRDATPSGAESIEWYDRFVRTGDRALLQRILEYNEDDCRAMLVLLEAVRSIGE